MSKEKNKIKIGMAMGAPNLPNPWFWVRKTFKELDYLAEKTEVPSFTFSMDGCPTPKRRGIPSAFWTCHAPERRTIERKKAREADIVFISTREFLKEFKQINARTYLLAAATDPKVWYPISLKEKYDIGFCGCFTRERTKLLRRLEEEGFKVRKHNRGEVGQTISLLPFEEVRKLYAESKLAFNYALPWGTSLNLRIFETLSMGRCLLTNKLLSEPDTTFRDRKHLVIYRNERELIDLTKYYLTHPKERKGIGEKGREEVLKKHTWEMRAEYIVKIMKKEFELNE